MQESLGWLLESPNRLCLLVDIYEEAPRSEIDRRYSSPTDSVEELRSRGFVYVADEEYRVSTIGERFAAAALSLVETANLHQTLRPVFEASPGWETVLPPIDTLKNATVSPDYAYSSESEQAYLDFVSGADHIREVNPAPQTHRILLEAIRSGDSSFLNGVCSLTLEILVPGNSPIYEDSTPDPPPSGPLEQVTTIKISEQFPFTLTIIEEEVGILFHNQLGAERSVFVRGSNSELLRWADQVYTSIKEEGDTMK